MRIPVCFGLMQHYCMMEQNRITVSSNFTGSMVGNIKSKQYEQHIHLIGHWLIRLDVDQPALQTNTGLSSTQITSKFGKEKTSFGALVKSKFQKQLVKIRRGIVFFISCPLLQTCSCANVGHNFVSPPAARPTTPPMTMPRFFPFSLGSRHHRRQTHHHPRHHPGGWARWITLGQNISGLKGVNMVCQSDYLETNIQWDFQGPKNGTPFPYYSHTTLLRIPNGNSMGSLP